MGHQVHHTLRSRSVIRDGETNRTVSRQSMLSKLFSNNILENGKK